MAAKIVAQGDYNAIIASEDSLTGAYLSGRRSIAIPTKRQKSDPKRQLMIKGAAGNNLKNVDLSLPIGCLTCITGVSGSGKSTLINGTLYPVAATFLNGATTLHPAHHDAREGPR